MVRSLIISILLLLSSLSAQERVLLHIGPDGRQEAIPLGKGESVRAAIEREQQRHAAPDRSDNSAGLVDTLKYFGTSAELTTNFGFNHQDAALQWYVPQAKGVVKEFWWLNYLSRGWSKKGTIRAWHMDPRLGSLPASPNTKYLGTYKDPADGDGGVQPFKPATGNQWFYSNGAADSVTYSYSPFLSESQWLPGGLQVTLDSNAWQRVRLADFGDSMIVKLGEPFGFTLSNDDKQTDLGINDVRMEILSIASSGAPYHSLKYYETGRTAPANAGWHLRGDYEWGMYVVMEYTGCRGPRFVVPFVGNTTSTTARTVNMVYEPSCSDTNLSAYVFYKIGFGGTWDSSKVNCPTPQGCSFQLPGAQRGDTVYWYLKAKDSDGNYSSTPIRSYYIFSGSGKRLFLHNNAAFTKANANLIYTGASTGGGFDYWSAPSDGTSELSTLLALYNDILLVDGSFPSRNVYTALKQRLDAATPEKPVTLFTTSQDYGCYIQAACADTSFGAGTLEYDYFGISKIGPQDLPPTNRPQRVIPQSDTVVNYLVRFAADSGVTLWSDPTFELAFAAYPDAIVPRAEAKALLKDGGSNVLAVKYITPKTRVMFASFEIGALQFRSDTVLTPANDPKYKWVPSQVGRLAQAFFKAHGSPTGVAERSPEPSMAYGLGQNYPNPFNPSTAFTFHLPQREHVRLQVFNVLGQHVADAVNEVRDAGAHTVQWNASGFASGVYFYTMTSGSFHTVRRMVLLK